MKMQGLRAGTIGGFGILAAWFVACAGEDIPPIDNTLRDEIAEAYGDANGAMAGAGAAGAAAIPGGSGGRNSGPSGGGAAGAGPAAGGSGSPLGGAGSGSGNGGPPCDAYNTILAESCGLSGCHGGSTSVGAFADSEDAIRDYLDEPSVNPQCDGLIVDTANPEQSLIYTKLTEDFDCGNQRMPIVGGYLDDEQLACVLSWLSQF